MSLLTNQKILTNAIVLVSTSMASAAITTTWNVQVDSVNNNTGFWGTATEWNNGVPNAIGDAAVIPTSTFGFTITLGDSGGNDASFTIGSLSISGNSQARTIQNVASGTGKLILDAESGNASVTSNGTGSPARNLNVPIQLNDTLNATVNNSSVLNFNRTISSSGEFGIVKLGTARAILGVANTYSGNTTVSAGTLEVGATGTLGSGSANVNATAAANSTLELKNNLAIADSASVFLTSDGSFFGRLNLNFSSSLQETVATLSFNGVQQAAGTWGATGSGATNINDNYFVGTGVLNVVPEPASLSLLGLAAAGVLRRRR